ncbi:glycosyltransferase [Candidatus Dependentiae bacterium]
MKNKIKLLHVTSSLKIGGAEAVLCDIVRTLGHQDFEHHVIYFHEGPNVEKIKNIGAQVYPVKGLLCLYDPVFFVRLFFLIKKLKPDLVHSLLWSANVSSRVVSRILKIPHVSAYHLDIYSDSMLRKLIDNTTRRMSDCVIAVSDDVALSLGDRKKYKKLEIIKNGIDFHDIHNNVIKSSAKKNDMREAMGIGPDDFVIGSVGRLHPQKNFSLLLKSFARISKRIENARLVIVGVGELEYELKRLAHNLGITQKVYFVIGKRACDYYPMFDCFVQSSLKEGLSIALLEAMSFELPCVVTNGPEAHPVIKHKKNGFIVESENEAMLCDAIVQVIDNKAFAEKLAASAKKGVMEGFSVDVMAKQYKTVFDELAS